MNPASRAKMSWAGHEPVVESARTTLLEYLRTLGIRGESLLNSLAEECLQVARRRVGPGSGEELLRRAIDEAQRRFDVALAHLLGLSLSRDLHQIAGARAALLMCRGLPASDFLFDAEATDPEIVSRLKAALPMATPPEVPRPMAPQKLDFVLFKSS